MADSAKPVVAAFDFDGTITTRDTFVPFLSLAFGRRRVVLAFAVLAVEGVKVWLRLSTRDHFKELIVAKLFRDASVSRLSAVGREHARRIESLIRPAALERIRWHHDQGHHLVMVSASLDLYLQDIAEHLGFQDLLCTAPSRDQSAFDGGLEGPNCRGPEKVRRLEALLGDLSAVELYAYGDSAGDREMLAAADHPYYRPFEAA